MSELPLSDSFEYLFRFTAIINMSKGDPPALRGTLKLFIFKSLRWS